MLNKVSLIGRLGKDPEIRHTPNGDAVVNLSLATTENWKDKATGERRQSTEWHRITYFGKLADIAGQYLNKGSMIYVEGQIKTRKYTDSAGVEKYATDIHGRELRMLGSSSGESAERQEPKKTTELKHNAELPDDDIPF